MDPVLSHLRSGHRRDVGHVGNIHSLLLEHSSTSGTVVVGHRHIHWRPRQLICRGRLPVAEVPHARLSTRTSGLVGPSTLGERRRLTLAGPLGGGELPAQLLDRRGQTRVVTLQSVYLDDKIVVLTGWRVSVYTHSRSIRICPAYRNASAKAANQLRFDDVLVGKVNQKRIRISEIPNIHHASPPLRGTNGRRTHYALSYHLPVRRREDTVARFFDSCPAPYPPILLNSLFNWILDSTQNPIQFDPRPIRPKSCCQKVLSEFHAVPRIRQSDLIEQSGLIEAQR